MSFTDSKRFSFVFVFAFSSFAATTLANPWSNTALGQEKSPWLEKKVVFTRNDVALKVGNQVVVPASDMFRVYTVKQAQGAWLWVTASGVDKDVVVVDPKEGVAGWVKIADVVAQDDAIDYFTRVLNANNNDWFAHYMRGALYDECKEFDKSFADYDACVRLAPNSAPSYNNRGAAWYSKKDYDKAIADYNKAIEIDPKDAAAYDNRGVAWSFKKDYDKAIADYNKAIEIDPKNAAAYDNRGDAWRQKKEFEKALADLNKALEIDPKRSWAFQYRARVCRDQGRSAKAIEDYEKAIELDPLRIDENPREELTRMLATCSDEKVRDGKRAVDLATKACELEKWKEPNCLDTLAAAYAEAGKFEDAVKWQDKAIDLCTDSTLIGEFGERLKLYKDKKPYRVK